MSSELSNKKAVVVGVFVLIGLLFLLAGILTIGNLRNTFSRKVHLVTFFDEVGGLQKGGNILFAGVKIGTVKTVRFYSRTEVKVVMNVDRNAIRFIRADSKVKVGTDGLIGNKILVIYGGSYLAEQVSEGDTIAADKTVSQEEMLNTLQENNRNLLDITENLKTISGKLAKGKGSIGMLLDDENIYNNISAASLSLRRASEKSSLAAGSVSEFSSKLNKKGTLLFALVNDTALYPSLKKALATVSQAADTASAMVKDIRVSVSNPKTPAGVLLKDEAAGANLKITLQNLESASKKLDEDLEGLQHSFLLKRYFRKKGKQ